ncbi:hypothetical protein Bbelb_154250 [Branchiostoma belcheri]|nr:hypothetical protein Bbelb_154250 [Branchiostoma belcheri]
MEEKIRRKLRLRLAEDIIKDQVGGAGWTYLDIALQVDKYSPKTVLVKTPKCDPQGNIVLEPKARERTINYLVPRDHSDATILDDVSVPVQAYPKETSWKQTYSLERSVSGNVSLKAVEAVGFSAEGSKTTKRYVETTCTDLEHRSVDIEDLRNALCDLSAQTSAEGMKDETSFLVVTDVLVAKDVSIVETQDAKHDGKVSLDTNIHGVGIGAGGGTTNKKVLCLERSNTGGIILAIKLARVHYDEQGTIERAGVLAGGSYDGYYTLGSGNKDRERHYTLTATAEATGEKKDKFEIKVNLLGRQSSTEVKVPQDVCETGKSLPTGSKLLPLKGILVSMLKGRKSLLHRLKHRLSSRKEEKVTLSKVLVTDLEQDQTYICPCSEEKAVTDDRSLWFDCRQWRDEVAENEFQVTVGGNSYSVYEEDPIVRVFGDRKWDDNGHLSVKTGRHTGRAELVWTNPEAKKKARDSVEAARTFKDYGIKANAVIEIRTPLREGARRGRPLRRAGSPTSGLELADEYGSDDSWPEEIMAGRTSGHKIGGMSGLEPGASGSELRTLPLRHTTPRMPFEGGWDTESGITCDLTFESCQVTLRVGEDERIHTLPEKVLSLLTSLRGIKEADYIRDTPSMQHSTNRDSRRCRLPGTFDQWLMSQVYQKMTDRQRLDDFDLQWGTRADPNKLVFKIQDVNPDVTGLEIQVTVPESKLKMTVQKHHNVGDIMSRLRRVYARMVAVHEAHPQDVDQEQGTSILNWVSNLINVALTSDRLNVKMLDISEA